jgi:hypothetical protein
METRGVSNCGLAKKVSLTQKNDYKNSNISPQIKKTKFLQDIKIL